MTLNSQRIHVAFGPPLPGIGAWEWIGADLAQALDGRFETSTFRDQPPAADAVVFVKEPPRGEMLRNIGQQSAIIFCPVDLYGRSAEIDRDWRMLRACDLVVVHCGRLRPYVQSYARVEYLDHHLKHVVPPEERRPSPDGPILWTGMRKNLVPLVEFLNHREGRQTRGERLSPNWLILTNLKDGERAGPRDFGFAWDTGVRIERWSADRHREALKAVRAVIDIKGTDFRQRHKPPTKAVEALASGLPLALNRESASAEHLLRLGFEVATPDDPRRWFSGRYRTECEKFGETLRETLSLARIAQRFGDFVESAIAERQKRLTRGGAA